MADFIVNGPISNTVVGTEGEDRLIYKLLSGIGGVVLDQPTDSAVSGYEGQFQTAEEEDTAFTGIENFTFIDTVGGDDTITTAGGADVLTGRGGDDTLTGGAGSDELLGGTGRDRLYGGDDGDTLQGGNGLDRLFGENGHDSLYGGDGNDRIYGGTGNDFLDGGAGRDLLNGGADDDFIIADQGADVVNAGRGADQVEIAFDTAKTVDGGLGGDMLMPFYEGAAGTATLIFDLATGVFESTDADIAGTTAINFEDFAFGGEIDIRVSGTDGGNEITGGFGDDTLRGRDGKDTLYGSDGDDTLLGNIAGDRLDGGIGDDVLTGGRGLDTFVFNGGSDTVTDFKDNVDTVEIDSGLLAEGTTVADLIDAASVTGGDTVLDFGGDDVLTIVGLTDASLLSDDLVIV